MYTFIYSDDTVNSDQAIFSAPVILSIWYNCLVYDEVVHWKTFRLLIYLKEEYHLCYDTVGEYLLNDCTYGIV